MITNCTFWENTGQQSVTNRRGDAICNTGSVIQPNLTLFSCTFVKDSSSDIYNDGHLTIRNTIVASLLNTNGTVTSDGYNLCRTANSLFTGPGDQTNIDPQFDPAGLQYNGGPTQTIALTAGSPAIDKGNSFGLTYDQRGSTRPTDNPGISNLADGSDIGAYEAPTDPMQPGPSLLVTSYNDHDDNICGFTDCTLREAIQRAKQLSGSNTIEFTGSGGTVILTMGELAVTDSLAINGANLVTISGNNASRIFSFTGGDSFLVGLTIRDGFNQTGNFLGQTNTGGGIANSATLSVYGCSFINNRVFGGQNVGGANGGIGEGGAIYNSGTLSLNGSTFLQTNRATGGNGGNGNSGHGGVPSGNGGHGRGGAVFNDATGLLSITNCTFNGSVALGGNGGSGGPAGGNGGNGDGGAIYNLGAMAITSATISGNSGGGGAAGTGTTNGTAGTGSNGVTVGGGNATAANTIIAGNVYVDGRNDDVDGVFSSSGYNLIGNGDFSTGFNASGDQMGTTAAPINPHLGPLQDNGGGTDTMALLANSPAIDQGKSFDLATDQRGHERPFDAPNISNASGGDGSDIGALELGGTLVPINAVSRQTHGAAGPFDIPLPLTNSVGVECRSGGATGDYQIVVTFAAPVTVTGNPQAQITSGIGQIGTGGTSNGGLVSVNGAIVTVPLTNVANAQNITLTLFSASDGANTNNVTVPMGILLGDTNGNGSVNASDIGQTKALSGQTTTGTNFRADVNVNGSINATDIGLVKSKSGTSLP